MKYWLTEAVHLRMPDAFGEDRDVTIFPGWVDEPFLGQLKQQYPTGWRTVIAKEPPVTSP